MRVNLDYLLNLVRTLSALNVSSPNTAKIDKAERDYQERKEAIGRIERDLGIYPPREFP